MILQTLASLLILAVTAAPGRVFERRIDQRAPRHYRSTFAEYVELVMIGATTTFVAVVVVVLVGGLFGGLDIGRLLPHPRVYVREEPWRIAGGSAVAIALSFFLAYVVPPLIVKRPKKGEGWDYYQHSAWLRNFLEQKPKNHAVALAAQFNDGYKAAGILTGFTPTQGEDREMVLQKVKVGNREKPMVGFPGDNFLIVRESQISWMIGEYVEKTSPDTTASSE